MSAAACWFGPPERPIFGWVHTPATGVAKAGIVICPSLGLEAGFSYSTLRRLADRLAELGFIAIRFDYDGTGDSAGEVADPQRVIAWQDSIGHALELLRSMTDRPVALLGMRVGALLAGYQAQRDGQVDALVLWDPPRSGRSYLKELRARHTISFGDDLQTASMLSFMGMSFSPETAADVTKLDLRSFERLPAPECLILQAPGRTVLTGNVLTSTGGTITVIEAADQAELLLSGALPVQTSQHVLDWFEATFGDVAPTKIRPSEATVTSLVRGQPGERCTEHIVALGPHQLFGIVSEPEHREPGPTVIFVPDATTPHVGLSRMWVDLARHWAAKGVRVLRFDLSGNGDSEMHPGQRLNAVAALVHFDNVREVAEAMSPADPSDVVLIGICSGAYQAIEAALDLSARGALLMNPAFAFVTPEWPPDKRRKGRQATRRSLAALFGRPVGALARRLSPELKAEEGFPWNRWFEACFWQRSITRRTSVVPEAAWWIINRLLLNQLPVSVVRRMIKQGTDVHVICGYFDIENVALGARRALARLQAGPNFTLTFLPELDHSVMKSGQRESVMSVLSEHVVTRYGRSDLDAAEVTRSTEFEQGFVTADIAR